jgi:hypothetical protein
MNMQIDINGLRQMTINRIVKGVPDRMLVSYLQVWIRILHFCLDVVLDHRFESWIADPSMDMQIGIYHMR